MQFKKKIITTNIALLIMMVAPAQIYAEQNQATTNNHDQSVLEVQAPGNAWVTQDGLTQNALSLIHHIDDAEAHGLNPLAYDVDSLEQDALTYITNGEISTKQHDLEKKFNKAFSLFASHMGKGVLEAQKINKGLHRSAPKVETALLLDRIKQGTSTVEEIVNELTPSSAVYANLVNHMRNLLTERQTNAARTKVRLMEAAKPGLEHASIIDLRKRLQETGDLDSYLPLGLLYSDEVVRAVMTFQERHGITETGELDESTVIALNADIDKDIEQIAMNLERWRWLPRDLGERHIMINVPAYELTMMNEETVITQMPVVVGSKKHKTPLFSETAKFVEVAPTWTVPASITNNEIIPQERKTPGYIDKQRMDYFKWDGNRLRKVARSSVTAADFRKKRFPYVLRQRAGEKNALGGIKILMPNKHAVYMHDTQAKSLFAKTDRAYSHGCIRLSEPFHLGGLLLQLDGKSPEETQDLLAKKKTTRVTLENPTATHIVYYTAWVDDQGKLNTRKDVYGKNKNLLAGLYENNTLLSTLKSRPVAIIAEQNEL